MLRASISGTSGYYCRGDVGHLLYRCTTSAVVFYIAPWCWSRVISLYDFCCCLLTLLPDVGHLLYRCTTSAVVFLHCSLMLVTCYIAVRLLLLSSYIAPWCWSLVISLYDFCCCLLTLLPDVGHVLYRCTTSAVVFLHCSLMLVTCYIAVRLLLLSSYIATWCWSLVISLYDFCCCLLTLLPIVGVMLVTCYIAVRLLLLSSYIAPYCRGDVGHLLYRCTTSAVVFLHCSLMLVTCYIAVRLLLLSSYIAPWCWSRVISLYDFCCRRLTLLPDVGHLLYRCTTSAVVFFRCSLL